MNGTPAIPPGWKRLKPGNKYTRTSFAWNSDKNEWYWLGDQEGHRYTFSHNPYTIARNSVYDDACGVIDIGTDR